MPEINEKTFVPPRSQRGEGQPSPKLRQHMGTGTARSGSTFSAVQMILHLFLFFFTMPVLSQIAKFTNEKAEEIVYKVKCTGKNDKVYYKVSTSTHIISTITHTHEHTFITHHA